MTLINELGMEELFKGKSDTLFDSLVSNINEINLVQFIGILSLFGYTYNKYEEYYPKLKKYFNTNLSKDVYSKLENIKPLFKNIENISSVEIQNLLEAKLSNDLIKQVAYTEPITLQQNFSYSGIYHLFNLLFEFDLYNFENWIINTKRTDFKIIFLDNIFGHYRNRYINVDNLDASQLGIVQSFYALSRFQIDKMCRNVYCNNENITLLFNTNLPERSKFVIYLQYIIKKYHGLNSQKINGHEDFKNDIKNFKNINYDYTEDELFNVTGVYYSLIGFKIILQLEDNNKKQLFLEKLQNKLLVYLSKERFIDSNIDYANLLGFIAIELKTCSNLEKYFNKKYRELSFPYSFCKIKNWKEQVVYMFYLLIGLFVYKKTNNQEFKNYVQNLKFIIGNIKCYTIKDFDEYIEQMK